MPEKCYPNDREDALRRISAVSMASVTDWRMQREPGKRAPVPAMPQAERSALLALDWLESTGPLTAAHDALQRALARKLAHRASLESVSQIAP